MKRALFPLLVAGLAALAAAACAPPVVGSPGGAPKSCASKPAGVTGDELAGRQLFMAKGCVACHVAAGVQAGGNVGPNLNGIGDPGKRPMLAGNQLQNTPPNVRQWMREPQAIKPGTAMPNLGLNEKESEDLLAFLMTLC